MALKHVKSCSTSLTHKITEMQIQTKLRYYILHIRPEKNLPHCGGCVEAGTVTR